MKTTYWSLKRPFFCLLWLGLLVSGGVACAPSPHEVPCVVTYGEPDEQGQREAVATCDRQAPIPLDPAPPQGSTCTLDLELGVLQCTDTRYDPETGRPLRVSTPSEGENEEPGEGGEGGEGVETESTSLTLPARAKARPYGKTPCTLILDQVICPTGARASLAHLSSSEREQVTACNERVLPGLGQRILCGGDRIGAGETHVLVPEGLDLEEEEVCDVFAERIVCSEGTTIELEPGQTCPNPRIETQMIDIDVLLSCLDEADEDADGEDVAIELSPRCRDAMATRVVCDGESIDVSHAPSACIAPTGQIRISTQDDAERFRALECIEVWGDIVIAPPERDAEFEGFPWQDDERVPVSWLLALDGVRGVHGSLQVEHTSLMALEFEEAPLNPALENARTVFQEGVDQLELGFVTGDYRFIGQKGLLTWRWPEALTLVAGSLELTGLEIEALEIEGLPLVNVDVGGALVLQSMASLERTEIENLELSGQVFLIATDALVGCELAEFLDWAFENARGLVWIQAFWSRPDSPSDCKRL